MTHIFELLILRSVTEVINQALEGKLASRSIPVAAVLVKLGKYQLIHSVALLELHVPEHGANHKLTRKLVELVYLAVFDVLESSVVKKTVRMDHCFQDHAVCR